MLTHAVCEDCLPVAQLLSIAEQKMRGTAAEEKWIEGQMAHVLTHSR
jgi:hypothetical protein